MSDADAGAEDMAPDLVVDLRRETVAALLRYRDGRGTLVGDAVEDERIDVIEPGDMPRLLVFADENSRQVGAGPLPQLGVDAKLVVQAFVERAQGRDAIADVDLLIRQIKDCLFRDPRWVRHLTRLTSVTTARGWKSQTERVLGQGSVTIECVLATKQTYPPRVETPLDKIAVTVAVPGTPT